MPRVFTLKNIEIDKALLDGADSKTPPAPAPEPKHNVSQLEIPSDAPSAEVSTGKMAPAAPTPGEFAKPIVNEKPVASEQVKEIARVQDTARQAMDQDLDSMKNDLLKDPGSTAKALIHIPDGGSKADTGNTDAAGMAAAAGRLDKLISGGLHAGDAPVTLPGGALFEFDKAELLTAAIDQLRQLGTLIKKNPRVTFTIEGYTDSFGDAAYNQQLSQNRAEAVRTWLVQNMDIDPANIKAVGYGATRFVAVPKPVDMHSQESIEAEKLHEQGNRRVEIRFNFPQEQ